MLLNPPVLGLPRLGYKFTLDTDAFDKQVGCTLLQDQPSGDRLPIGYWSRALTPAEKNYSTTERECLAVVWAILTLRPYLLGVKFTLRTDHGPLQWILNLADASGRLARWRLRLLEYEFDVQYNPGREHHLADAMSRLPTDGGDTTEFNDEIPCFTLGELPNGETENATWYVAGETDEPTEPAGTPWAPEMLALTEEQTDVTPISVDEFLQEQASDAYCAQVAKTVGTPGTQFDYDKYGYLVRKSPLDGAL